MRHLSPSPLIKTRSPLYNRLFLAYFRAITTFRYFSPYFNVYFHKLTVAQNSARKTSLLAWTERLATSVSYLACKTTRNVGLPCTDHCKCKAPTDIGLTSSPRHQRIHDRLLIGNARDNAISSSRCAILQARGGHAHNRDGAP